MKIVVAQTVVGKCVNIWCADQSTKALDLRKAHGPFEIRWINVGTGEWDKRAALDGGGVATIAAPAKGHWVAGIVRVEGGSPSPVSSGHVGEAVSNPRGASS